MTNSYIKTKTTEDYFAEAWTSSRESPHYFNIVNADLKQKIIDKQINIPPIVNELAFHTFNANTNGFRANPNEFLKILSFTQPTSLTRNQEVELMCKLILKELHWIKPNALQRLKNPLLGKRVALINAMRYGMGYLITLAAQGRLDIEVSWDGYGWNNDDGGNKLLQFLFYMLGWRIPFGIIQNREIKSIITPQQHKYAKTIDNDAGYSSDEFPLDVKALESFIVEELNIHGHKGTLDKFQIGNTKYYGFTRYEICEMFGISDMGDTEFKQKIEEREESNQKYILNQTEQAAAQASSFFRTFDYQFRHGKNFNIQFAFPFHANSKTTNVTYSLKADAHQPHSPIQLKKDILQDDEFNENIVLLDELKNILFELRSPDKSDACKIYETHLNGEGWEEADLAAAVFLVQGTVVSVCKYESKLVEFTSDYCNVLCRTNDTSSLEKLEADYTEVTKNMSKKQKSQMIKKVFEILIEITRTTDVVNHEIDEMGNVVKQLDTITENDSNTGKKVIRDDIDMKRGTWWHHGRHKLNQDPHFKLHIIYFALKTIGKNIHSKLSISWKKKLKERAKVTRYRYYNKSNLQKWSSTLAHNLITEQKTGTNDKKTKLILEKTEDWVRLVDKDKTPKCMIATYYRHGSSRESCNATGSTSILMADYLESLNNTIEEALKCQNKEVTETWEFLEEKFSDGVNLIEKGAISDDPRKAYKSEDDFRKNHENGHGIADAFISDNDALKEDHLMGAESSVHNHGPTKQKMKDWLMYHLEDVLYSRNKVREAQNEDDYEKEVSWNDTHNQHRSLLNRQLSRILGKQHPQEIPGLMNHLMSRYTILKQDKNYYTDNVVTYAYNWNTPKEYNEMKKKNTKTHIDVIIDVWDLNEFKCQSS